MSRARCRRHLVQQVQRRLHDQPVPFDHFVAKTPLFADDPFRVQICPCRLSPFPLEALDGLASLHGRGLRGRQNPHDRQDPHNHQDLHGLANLGLSSLHGRQGPHVHQAACQSLLEET